MPGPHATTSEGGDFVVCWFRASRSRRTLIYWATGGFAATIGMLLNAVAAVVPSHGSAGLQAGAAALGALALTSAVLCAVMGTRELLTDETVLIVRGDGVRYTRRGESVFIGWRELVAVERVDERVDLLREGGGRVPITARFDDATHEVIAAALIDVQRRALLGLLRPDEDGPAWLIGERR